MRLDGADVLLTGASSGIGAALAPKLAGAAIEGEGFEHYLPDLKGVVEFKTSDIDAFLAGSAEAMGQTDEG